MRRIFTLFFFVLVLSGCKNLKNDDLLPYDESHFKDKEVNDKIENSTEVITQNPIIGYYNIVENSGDKDYYKVNFSLKETSYQVVLTPVPGIDSILSFYLPNGRLLFKIDRGKKGEAEKLWDYYPNSDYITMLVESKINSNEKVPYVVNFIPKKDQGINETEPNNDFTKAVLIKLNDEKKGLISPKGDIDFYKVQIIDENFYNYSIKIEILSNIDVLFEVIDDENNLKKQINSFGFGGREFFPYLSNSKGDYFIKVTGNLKSYDRKDPVYYLSIIENENTEDDEDVYYESEFNDNKDFATELISNSEVLGAFYPQQDEDWYSFDIIKKSDSVDLLLSRIRGVDPVMEVYDNNLEPVRSINDNGLDSGESINLGGLKKGRYYVRLYSENKSLQIYKLFYNVRYK